jgi:twitching motility protein PilT
VHSSTAAGAISRIVDVFPAGQAPQIRLQLSQTLRMVFAQRLVPSRVPETRALVYEVLVNTPAVANLIRVGEIEQIPNAISAGRDHGMISFLQCERELVARGIIGTEVETAGTESVLKRGLRSRNGAAAKNGAVA